MITLREYHETKVVYSTFVDNFRLILIADIETKHSYIRVIHPTRMEPMDFPFDTFNELQYNRFVGHER